MDKRKNVLLRLKSLIEPAGLKGRTKDLYASLVKIIEESNDEIS